MMDATTSVIDDITVAMAATSDGFDSLRETLESGLGGFTALWDALEKARIMDESRLTPCQSAVYEGLVASGEGWLDAMVEAHDMSNWFPN